MNKRSNVRACVLLCKTSALLLITARVSQSERIRGWGKVLKVANAGVWIRWKGITLSPVHDGWFSAAIPAGEGKFKNPKKHMKELL